MILPLARRRWDLDAWDMQEPELCRLLLYMFYSTGAKKVTCDERDVKTKTGLKTKLCRTTTGLIKGLSLKPSALMAFFEKCVEKYYDNPFHSAFPRARRRARRPSRGGLEAV